MSEEGLPVCDAGHRYTTQKRFRNAGRVCYACIDNEALEAFLERSATGGAAAAIASQGGRYAETGGDGCIGWSGWLFIVLASTSQRE